MTSPWLGLRGGVLLLLVGAVGGGISVNAAATARQRLGQQRRTEIAARTETFSQETSRHDWGQREFLMRDHLVDGDPPLHQGRLSQRWVDWHDLLALRANVEGVPAHRATADPLTAELPSLDAEILAARAELTRVEDGAFAAVGEPVTDAVALQIAADGTISVIRASVAPVELQHARTRLRDAYAKRLAAIDSLLELAKHE